MTDPRLEKLDQHRARILASHERRLERVAARHQAEREYFGPGGRPPSVPDATPHAGEETP